MLDVLKFESGHETLSRQLEAILTVDNISEFNLYVLRNLGDHHPILSIRVKIWKIFEEQLAKDAVLRRTELTIINLAKSYSKFALVRLALIAQYDADIVFDVDQLMEIAVRDPSALSQFLDKVAKYNWS